MTPGPREIDNTPAVRRVIQVVHDLAHGSLAGLRILDLACAHGAYSIELAHRGATVLGIEGRASWLAHACRARDAAGLTTLEFVQDDVRYLSREKYGEFDIVLCLGILYHLDAPDVFGLVRRVAEVCRQLAIVETHVATEPAQFHEWRGHRYAGVSRVEHPPGTSPEEKLRAIAQSLDNETAFWLTRASLCNLLRHVGFTSVYDCANPVANLWVGPERAFRIWGTRITLAAIKGEPVRLVGSPEATAEREADWPERVEDYFFERDVAAGAQISHAVDGPHVTQPGE
jgi:SAM-dependent methyltransferase